MNIFELDYKKVLSDTMLHGTLEENRTGINAISSFNKSITINLEKGFPIVTGRKIFFDKAYHEYYWIKEGLTTTTYLNQHNIKWWDEYADNKGNLGKTYGYQLRNFNGEIDQLEYIHNCIRFNSRQSHITLWNPSELKETKLPPCYTGMTFMKQEGKYLNMSIQLRSSDLMLGLPYDIIVAALLLIEIAEFNELTPRYLGIQITNAHIYENHKEQFHQYLNSDIYSLPKLIKSTSKDSKTPYELLTYEHGQHLQIPLNK